MVSTIQAGILKTCLVFVSLAVIHFANSQFVDIATDKPATMSSVSEDSDPQFAVDGNITEDSTCSIANSLHEGDLWWRLDLTKTFLVRQVDIHLTAQYIQDGFPDTQVYVTDTPEVPDDTRGCQVITSDSETDRLEVLKMHCESEGRYIVIVRRENNTELTPFRLVLCEVNVHVCHNDFYGPNCSLTCGQCGLSGCDQVTGACNGGCKNGYTGNMCNKALTTAEGLSPLAAGAIGAAVITLIFIIVAAVIILVICCCMEKEKKIKTDMTPGVYTVGYGRKNMAFQEDTEANSANSLDRNQSYEQIDLCRYESITPVSKDGVIATVVLTPAEDDENVSNEENTSSTDPQYLLMSCSNHQLYEPMDRRETRSDPDDTDDPEATELPKSLIQKSLGENSDITISERNTYENTQL